MLINDHPGSLLPPLPRLTPEKMKQLYLMPEPDPGLRLGFWATPVPIEALVFHGYLGAAPRLGGALGEIPASFWEGLAVAQSMKVLNV